MAKLSGAPAIPPDLAEPDAGDSDRADAVATFAPRLITGSTAPHVQGGSLESMLGSKVRRLRQRVGITAADLASEAGLSAGMLSKIENGATSPSLGTVQALARALNVPVASLFSEFDERRDCSFVKAGQGVTIDRRGTKSGHRYQLLGHSLRGDLVMEPYLITLSEDAAPYTQFQHEGLELIYMLSGRLVYRHGDTSYEMGPGDALFFDSQAQHGPETLLELPTNFLSIIVYARS
jgi:transcriptional regulator with XRE-family HTH domain